MLRCHITAQYDHYCGTASTKKAGTKKNAFVHQLE
jgi:hypothetical protein